jgi:hypothetical protein
MMINDALIPFVPASSYGCCVLVMLFLSPLSQFEHYIRFYT